MCKKLWSAWSLFTFGLFVIREPIVNCVAAVLGQKEDIALMQRITKKRRRRRLMKDRTLNSHQLFDRWRLFKAKLRLSSRNKSQSKSFIGNM